MNDYAFTPDRNCWRVEKADRFAVIIDGADYFRALREALLKAQRLVILIGWDFDFEIEMLPGESDADGNAPDGFPNAIGPFLDALAERRSGLDIYLLKWSGGALIAPGGVAPALKIKLLAPEQIHLAFDGRHPIGASHHQKVVAIDDSLAFCGGIDVTAGRWDTHAHLSDDPCRADHNGEIAPPWHDATTVMSGPAAAMLSILSRQRWERAHDRDMDESFEPSASLWPESIVADFEDIDVAISRTFPPEKDRPITAEIEQLYLDSIAAARDVIYLESQYFAADSITEALRRRLQEPDGPEIVVINPDEAQNLVEDRAMHITRSRMIRSLSDSDPQGRFVIVYPVNDAGEDIYVHAKICIFDDRFLRIGSSNIDRRSMGFDTECDVAIIADRDEDRTRITQIRDGLLAEHLGVDLVTVQRAIERQGGLIDAIDSLNNSNGRGLRPITPRREGPLGKFLANTRFFDPRYRRSAEARLGVTSRHVMIGTATLAAGLAIWMRWRRKRR